MRHVGQELRLQRRGLLELEGLAAQQLVLPASSAVASRTFASQLVGGALDLLVEARLLHRLGSVVEDGDDGGRLAVLGEDLAGDRLDRQRRAGLTIGQRRSRRGGGVAARRSRPETNEVNSASLARTRARRLVAARGAPVNSRSAGGFISTMLPAGRSPGSGRPPSR